MHALEGLQLTTGKVIREWFTRGTFGHIYSLNDGSTVVKIVPFSRETRNEVRILRRLIGKDHIIQLLHTSLIEKYPLPSSVTRLALEFTQYECDLSVLIRRGIPLDLTRKFFLNIAQALVHCHLLNIIHRDVKPENILIHGRSAILSDFGSSIQLSDHPLGTNVATLPYRAPELIRAQLGKERIAKYDGKIDVWALGCVLYEMISQSRAFFHSCSPDEEQILKDVNREQELFSCDELVIDDDLKRIWIDTMHLEPDHRCDSQVLLTRLKTKIHE